MVLTSTNQLTVSIEFGNSGVFVTEFTADLSGYARPNNLIMGFTGSTGGSTDIHQVQDVALTSVVANLWTNTLGQQHLGRAGHHQQRHELGQQPRVQPGLRLRRPPRQHVRQLGPDDRRHRQPGDPEPADRRPVLLHAQRGKPRIQRLVGHGTHRHLRHPDPRLRQPDGELQPVAGQRNRDPEQLERAADPRRQRQLGRVQGDIERQRQRDLNRDHLRNRRLDRPERYGNHLALRREHLHGRDNDLVGDAQRQQQLGARHRLGHAVGWHTRINGRKHDQQRGRAHGQRRALRDHLGRHDDADGRQLHAEHDERHPVGHAQPFKQQHAANADGQRRQRLFDHLRHDRQTEDPAQAR